MTRLTPELQFAVCRRLAAGQLLDDICVEPGMPPLATLARWMATSPRYGEWMRMIERSEALAHLRAAIAVADDDGNATRTKQRIDVRWKTAAELTETPSAGSGQRERAAPGKAPAASRKTTLRMDPDDPTSTLMREIAGRDRTDLGD